MEKQKIKNNNVDYYNMTQLEALKRVMVKRQLRRFGVDFDMKSPLDQLTFKLVQVYLRKANITQ